MPISFSPPADRDLRARGAGVTAVLGPTNTGKTHLAIERMLAHSSGLIGLPLRLLAREVYNKAVERVGAEAVALDHRRREDQAAKPAFLGGDRRGDAARSRRRLSSPSTKSSSPPISSAATSSPTACCNRRGREETLVLGAATMKPIVERLLPGASIVSRPRLSQLTFAGEKKLTRLPRRSAIVAFSADEVYAIAELIRRQRGGAAVVLGALSPRTRNAQVELYQSGQVDYLVATDAIGMGLNLDVDHIAFASDRKFDGYQFRKLSPSELAQIAGRAGRATRDGTFGTSGRCPPFETELVQALEIAHFRAGENRCSGATPISTFRRSARLQASLGDGADRERADARAGRRRHPRARSRGARRRSAQHDRHRAPTSNGCGTSANCPITARSRRPTMPSSRSRCSVICSARAGSPTDWFAQQVAQADRTDGDIDTLSTRIAHIRTWTFAANRPDWLADPEHWQGVTRAVEDRLSDALHERLTERFVDRRTSVLMRRLARKRDARARIQQDRRGRGRGPCHRPARWLRLSCRMRRQAARKPKPCRTPRRRRWRARSRSVRRGLPKRRTINSCWRPTARCAGSAPRSASLSPATRFCGRACASLPTSN